MTLEIRRAVESDAPSVAPLFEAYRKFFTGEDWTNSLEFIAERLKTQDSVVLYATVSGEPAGFLQLYPLYSSWYATRIWFLSDLYVAERFRKEKIGRKLVAEAQRFAKETGSRSIMVEIPHSEPHLVTFYENLSFMRDKTFDLYRFYIE